MKNFLAIYLGSSDGAASAEWEGLDEATRQKRIEAGMTGWMTWAKTNASIIADQGAPLGKTKRIDRSGVVDVKNLMTAYTIVQSENHADAAALFVNHPHFMIFPGDAVEVMECLPMPTR